MMNASKNFLLLLGMLVAVACDSGGPRALDPTPTPGSAPSPSEDDASLSDDDLNWRAGEEQARKASGSSTDLPGGNENYFDSDANWVAGAEFQDPPSGVFRQLNSNFWENRKKKAPFSHHR